MVYFKCMHWGYQSAYPTRHLCLISCNPSCISLLVVRPNSGPLESNCLFMPRCHQDSRIKDGSNKQHANGPHAPAAAMSEFTVNLLCDLDTGG